MSAQNKFAGQKNEVRSQRLNEQCSKWEIPHTTHVTAPSVTTCTLLTTQSFLWPYEELKGIQTWLLGETNSAAQVELFLVFCILPHCLSKLVSLKLRIYDTYTVECTPSCGLVYSAYNLQARWGSMKG